MLNSGRKTNKNKSIMKKVEKTIERTDTIVEWVAADGTVFKTQSECEKYEQCAKCAIRAGLRDIAGDETTGDVFPTSSCDDVVYYVVPKDAADIEAIRKYMAFLGYEHCYGISKDDIGQPLCVIGGYGDEWGCVGRLSDLVANLTNGEYTIAKVESK